MFCENEMHFAKNDFAKYFAKQVCNNSPLLSTDLKQAGIIRIEKKNGKIKEIYAENIIISTGSKPRMIPNINIDETTHYLSPKVLDRAHVIKFDNPLLSDWDSIYKEVDESGIEKKDHKIRFSIDDFGKRTPYPKFDKDNEFCQKIIDITKEHLKRLDVEVGLRTIRQGLNYQDTSAAFKCGESVTMNNFL